MLFTKCFVVLLALIGAICQSKIVVKTRHSEGSPKLEEAAIKILKHCYEHQQKEAVLSGDFPENFIKSLSSYRSFSLIFMNDKQSANKFVNGVYKNRYKSHNINLVIVSASDQKRVPKLLMMYMNSRYYNTTAAYLMLDWSPKNKYPICNGKRRTVEFLIKFSPRFVPNMKMMCDHRLNGIMIYNSNFYTNQIPKSWKLSEVFTPSRGPPDFYLLEQQYREYETMCKNLDFDKSRNLGKTPLNIFSKSSLSKLRPDTTNITTKIHQRFTNNYVQKQWYLFENFLNYVNATPQYVLEENYLNLNVHDYLLPGIYGSNRPFANPFKTVCRSLHTKFRGYKSQLQKIIDVLDIYSWIGTYGVVIVTLLFFKYFLRQPMIVGILNITRLISNTGLTTVPQNLPPQIYLSCLLCFVVTMQGIFVSNLAALLTQNIPVRQVNTLQDLIDLNYTTVMYSYDVPLFDRPEFKGRLVIVDSNRAMIKYMLYSSNACLVSKFPKDVMKDNIYASPNCIIHEYYANAIPSFWPLEKTMNEYMAMGFATNTLIPFDVMVDEKRFIELQSEEDEPEPRVIKFADLMFAFIILGCGLSIAFVTFIAELLIHRYQHKVKKTRVIVLN